MTRVLRATTVLFALSSIVIACGGDDTVFVTNGSNDLRKACEVRLGWKRSKEVKCLECITTAPLATCNCTVSAPYVGKCAQQLDLKRASADCDQPLERCVGSCSLNDCGCIDTCYATHQECRARASALEGCVSEVCGPLCE